MKISIITFTYNGAAVAKRLTYGLQAEKCTLYAKPSREGCLPVTEGLQDWCRQQFQTADALIFIGAAGIAVRTIAPFIKDKLTDPAVLVIDEQGKYIIPILSGHVGGGNALAGRIAEILSATPVITTATDLSGLFAVDVFARQNNLYIDCSMKKKLKDISTLILQGRKINIFIDKHIVVSGVIPPELQLLTDEVLYDKMMQESVNLRKTGDYVIAVTDKKLTQRDWLLQLTPCNRTLGIGCKKGISPQNLQMAVEDFLNQHEILRESIAAVASIDLKNKEEAILTLQQNWQVPFLTYRANQLSMLSGAFTASDFVAKTTGVDNVCERAALMSATERFGKDVCIEIKKTVYEGITLALAARRTIKVDFQ